MSNDRCRAFHELHKSGCFVMPNPWDVGSARLLAQLGFPALATTSSGFAWTLGRADNQVSLAETLSHFRYSDFSTVAELARLGVRRISVGGALARGVDWFLGGSEGTRGAWNVQASRSRHIICRHQWVVRDLTLTSERSKAMNRRDFVRLTGTGLTVGTLAEPLVARQVAAQPGDRRAATTSKARMKVGTQHGDSDAILRVLAGFGVNHICSRLPSASMDAAWSVEGLTRLRERVESFGITLDMVPLPLSSSEISRSENPAILLAQDPERDRQIDHICQMIRNTARAGIPAAKYNLTLIGIPRSAPTRGRGGATYSTFVYANAKQDPPLTVAGRVDEDTYWERITYFLKRVVPVAEEHKVRLACHPQDPGMPRGKGWRGVETVLGSVDGLKRFVSIAESPYHGLNFCQGTVSEMLEKPGEQIFDVIRYFGERRKIFNVHFRNISGGFLNFRETFIDDGDIDMLKAMRVYREVGYDGMMMPDHVPSIEGDGANLQGFAFAFGYIKALIAAVAAES